MNTEVYKLNASWMRRRTKNTSWQNRHVRYKYIRNSVLAASATTGACTSPSPFPGSPQSWVLGLGPRQAVLFARLGLVEPGRDVRQEAWLRGASTWPLCHRSRLRSGRGPLPRLWKGWLRAHFLSCIAHPLPLGVPLDGRLAPLPTSGTRGLLLLGRLGDTVRGQSRGAVA